MLTTFKILYNRKDITEDISYHVLSLTYTDKLTGECDELEILLEDKDQQWQNTWFPEKGAVITAEIISGGVVLPCGSFSIDEIEVSGSSAGDQASIRCVSASHSKKIRTQKSKIHEKKSLREIVSGFAELHEYTLMSDIEDIRIERKLQYQESDLHFLNRIAIQYGYAFSIKNDNLIFYKKVNIENKSSSITIDKTDCISYSIKEKSNNTYKSTSVKYYDPTKKESIGSVSTDDHVNEKNISDQYIINEHTENGKEAGIKAEAGLHNKNSKTREGSLVTPGNLILVSGNNFNLTGIGKLSGKMHITQSQHTLDKNSGFTTSIDFKRISDIPSLNHLQKGGRKNKPEPIVKHGHLWFIPDPKPAEEKLTPDF